MIDEVWNCNIIWWNEEVVEVDGVCYEVEGDKWWNIRGNVWMMGLVFGDLIVN